MWLRADRQTLGKGRLGRDWQSPLGNFYGSTLIRLLPGDPSPPTLALVSALAVHAAVSQAAPGISAFIKWPNDIMVGPAKLAGILLEREGDAVIIGVGVNLAHHPTDLSRPVTSLAAHATKAPSPDAFQHLLATTLDHWVAVWRRDGLAAIAAAWMAHAHPKGTRLAVVDGEGQALDGAFEGITPDGALQLRLADGRVRAIHAGDVFLI